MKNIAKPIYRVTAGLIDFLIPNLWFTYILFKISSSNSIEMLLEGLWVFVLWLFLQFLVFTLINGYLTMKFGGSLGKLLTGLEVRDSAEKRLTFGMSVLREIFKQIISRMFMWLGDLWLLIDKKHQTWQDMVVNSYVVTVNSKRYILGIIIAIIMAGIYIFLIKLSVDNFRMNSSLYISLFSEFF